MAIVLIQRLTVTVKNKEDVFKTLYLQEVVTSVFDTQEAVLEYVSKKGWTPKKFGKSKYIFHRELTPDAQESLHKKLNSIGAPVTLDDVEVDCTYIQQEILMRSAGKKNTVEPEEKPKAKPKKKKD